MSYNKNINKVIETTVNLHENYENKFTFQVIIIVPTNLHQIQSRAKQVWNYDKIGFGPSGIWHKVVCTYKLFQG